MRKPLFPPLLSSHLHPSISATSILHRRSPPLLLLLLLLLQSTNPPILPTLPIFIAFSVVDLDGAWRRLSAEDRHRQPRLRARRRPAFDRLHPRPSCEDSGFLYFTYPNPLQDNPAYSVVKQYFVNMDDTVAQKVGKGSGCSDANGVVDDEGACFWKGGTNRVADHMAMRWGCVPTTSLDQSFGDANWDKLIACYIRIAKDDVICPRLFGGHSEIIVVHKDSPRETHFRRAGPRQKVYFESDEVHACIVTCGGLCPGLNTVIREIVCGLYDMYGVRKILGIEGGYSGFYSRNTISLTPKVVNDIHKRGGTILGTSRGGHDTSKIVDSIQDRGINQVYIIGGDGTQKGASVIFKEMRRRGLKVAIAGIPKTIDNDIAVNSLPVIDKSFGFDTAVEEAQRAINAAHVEAESMENGIGIVKLMGRYSGFIAMYATLASRDVDCCLIPESPFYLEGNGGVYEFIERRLKENGHMVIVIAEGAGQDLLLSEGINSVNQKDASGNKVLLDVGLWLSQKIKDHFTRRRKVVMNLKYIDPTYMIRAVPSNASDNVYCTLLAHSALHGAMAGYTGLVKYVAKSEIVKVACPCSKNCLPTIKIMDNIGYVIWAHNKYANVATD
ncbi:hypothetical protein Sjap_011561 [Stephania japonica]|uniref:Phosphofructokinase domain-containing protein n=1 Tax=Stephania japonica TaxID=461633 RepID=A0AAP0JBU8_9MAGN